MLVIAQIGSTAATARLIAPNEFGLYATAQAASGFASYFAMRAVGQDLQRRSDLGPKTAGTAMTVALGSSLLLGLCLWFGAPLWANMWGVPDATWTIRIFGPVLLLQSAATVPLALIRRRLHFGRAAVIETSSTVFGVSAGVALAIQLHSALALALGQLAGATCLLIATAIIVEDHVRPSFDRADGRHLLTFASQVGGLGLLAYFTNAVPSWYAARVYGASVLGMYSRANYMASLPGEYAVTSIYKVIYPLYGRVREDPERVRTLLSESLTLTTGLVWPVFAMVGGAAPIVVYTFLGPRWGSAAPLLTLCALTVCATIPLGLLTNCAEAFGWMRLIAARQLVFLAGVAVTGAVVYTNGLDVGYLLGGLAGAQWLTYGLTLSPFARMGLLDRHRILQEQGVNAALAAVVYGAAVGCTIITQNAPVAVQCAALITLVLILFAVLLVFWPWVPAGRILYRRLEQVAPAWDGMRLLRAFALSK